MDTNPVSYKEAIDGLSKAIHHLTWLGEFWGPEGVVALDEARARYLKDAGDERRAVANLQSTYYAAAGNANAQLAKSIFWKTIWFIRAVKFLAKSERMSDDLVRIAGGITHMMPDELDVRSHILRKMKKYDEAMQCIEEALLRKDIAPNSKALLLMGKAEIFAQAQEFGGAHVVYAEAISLYERYLRLIPSSTFVRILKSMAMMQTHKTIEARKKILDKAKSIALKEGLHDQIEKIEAIERSL